eukprot:scaffold50049_cov31-Tisochrysis_lutea.AAC.7
MTEQPGRKPKTKGTTKGGRNRGGGRAEGDRGVVDRPPCPCPCPCPCLRELNRILWRGGLWGCLSVEGGGRGAQALRLAR